MRERLLTPTTNGNMPGEDLYDFFVNRLPADLPIRIYNDGLSCLGYARLIVLELGGPRKARIYWIEEDDAFAHAYVVYKKSSPSDLAYNNTFGQNHTVEYILSNGIDITDDVFLEDWKKL